MKKPPDQKNQIRNFITVKVPLRKVLKQWDLVKPKFEVNEEMIFFADRKITDEDVLFNNKYFQAVCDGNSPESLEEWISTNYGTMIEKLAHKAKAKIKRLENYH